MIKRIRNLKISFKLYILVGVALIGMLIIGGMSFNLMGRLNEKTSDISTSWLPSVDTGRAMTAALSNIRLNELGYLTAISDEIEQLSLKYVESEKAKMGIASCQIRKPDRSGRKTVLRECLEPLDAVQPGGRQTDGAGKAGQYR